MATKSFTTSEAIKYGWETVKSRLWFFISLALSIWAVSYLFSKLSESFEKGDQGLLWFIILIASMIVQWGMSLGLYSILLRTAEGQKPKFDDLFSKFDAKLIFKYFVSSLLVGLAVLAGFILLIIPGIIVAIRLGFYYFILVEKKDVGPVEALKESWSMTKGHTLDLFILSLCLIGINILGLLVFVVGLLVSMPVSMLATAYVYHKLAKKTHS